ncbi:MAG: hypothetical protein Q4D93_00400 [Porphyromonas sp.]|nr:hypothetical protein [Porphyromonas sp.]
MAEKVHFNAHDKKEYPPMHTVEHVINGAMVKLFGTGRSVGTHIERMKSRMDFSVDWEPTDEDAQRLEDEVNAVLMQDLPVTFEVTTQAEASKYGVDLSRIPEDASQAVRIAKVGDYDTCLCIGDHVASTKECGRMVLYSHDYLPEKHRWRIRFKLEGEDPSYSID